MRELDRPGQLDGLEQAAVVGDEQQRAVPRRERLLELLDGRQVEVVRRLVEHEAVHAAGHEQRELGPGALPR